jgi:hypothetical protein
MGLKVFVRRGMYGEDGYMEMLFHVSKGTAERLVCVQALRDDCIGSERRLKHTL